MVLGFGSKKKKSSAEPVFIRASPSLPELAQQRIPWPEDFISPSVPDPDPNAPPAGPRKISFRSGRGSIPFHRPFRDSGGNGSVPSTPVSGPQPPPSSFHRSRTAMGRSTRRSKNPPTFNIMVAGAKSTGKSSILRLLLDTSSISPTNTPEQLMSLSMFRAAAARPTASVCTATLEIVQSPRPDDRVMLTCIDTPGLDFSEGKEFALDRAVSGLVRYLDAQFAETLGEESKVVRASKGDQHVHVCIYLIDPDSVMTPSARRARSRHSHGEPVSPTDLPESSEYDSGSDDDCEEEVNDGEVPPIVTMNGVHSDDGHDTTAAESTVSHDPVPAESTTSHDLAPTPIPAPTTPQLHTPPHSQHTPVKNPSNRLTLAPAEIRVITRLAKRVNVLPAVARADTLTDGRLARVKRAIRLDLAGAVVGGAGAGGAREGMGIFAVWDGEVDGVVAEVGVGGEVEEEEEEERVARPVIKLKERTRGSGLARSRSRKSLRSAAGVEYDEQGQEVGGASRRTSVGSAVVGGGGNGGTPVPMAMYNPVFSRAELSARIPFAIIAPEREREREKGVSTAASSQHGQGHGNGDAMAKVRFVRRFRWGTVNVLDPEHCDFAALRTAVLGNYMRALKATTKDVLYERYRTEKLLARRATRNITDDDRKRMLKDLGL